MKTYYFTVLIFSLICTIFPAFVSEPEHPPLKLHGETYKYCCTKYTTDTLDSGYGTIIIVTQKRMVYDAIDCKDINHHPVLIGD